MKNLVSKLKSKTLSEKNSSIFRATAGLMLVLNQFITYNSKLSYAVGIVLVVIAAILMVIPQFMKHEIKDELLSKNFRLSCSWALFVFCIILFCAGLISDIFFNSTVKLNCNLFFIMFGGIMILQSIFMAHFEKNSAESNEAEED